MSISPSTFRFSLIPSDLGGFSTDFPALALSPNEGCLSREDDFAWSEGQKDVALKRRDRETDRQRGQSKLPFHTAATSCYTFC